MSMLPLSAFPLCGKASKSGAFVLAVVVGLAFFLNQKAAEQSQTAVKR